MSGREISKSENESRFRAVNERLEDRAIERAGTSEASEAGEFAVLCECAREECARRVAISIAEYEQVRANPRTFIVAPGHAENGFERVLSSHGGYEIVEKFGEAGLVAQLDDPRGGS